MQMYKTYHIKLHMVSKLRGSQQGPNMYSANDATRNTPSSNRLRRQETYSSHPRLLSTRVFPLI